jgi:hypothetical protein
MPSPRSVRFSTTQRLNFPLISYADTGVMPAEISLFGQRASIYFLAREVILEGKLIVRPATMNTPSPW